MSAQPPPCDAATGAQRLWGKYRGTVIDTADPEVRGRLLCTVAALPGMVLNWATPCVPYAGIEQGFFALPPEGSDVWVEFERGDPDLPIWSGGFWGAMEEPLVPELDPELPELVNVLRSKFCTLLFNDVPAEGGLTLSAIDPVVPLPVTLRMDELGFSVTCGELSFTMDPAVGITLTAGETSMLLSVAAVTVEAPAVDVTAEATVDVTSPVTAVEGDVNVTGPVTVEGETNVTGAVTIEGETNVTGAVTVEGETNVTGAVTIEGETNVAGAMTVEGETNVAGAFTVEGDANFLGAQQTEGNCAVLGVIEGIVVPPLL